MFSGKSFQVTATELVQGEPGAGMSQVLASRGRDLHHVGEGQRRRVSGPPQTLCVQTRTAVRDTLTWMLPILLHQDKDYNDAIQ